MSPCCLAVPLSGLTGRFEAAVLEAESQKQADDEQQMESDYLDLKPLEQAVLWRLLEQGPRFRPYDAEALRFYKEKTQTAVSPQKALEALRERNLALVWKSARGEYSVADAAMHRWFQQRGQHGSWPPQALQPKLDLSEDAAA